MLVAEVIIHFSALFAKKSNSFSLSLSVFFVPNLTWLCISANSHSHFSIAMSNYTSCFLLIQRLWLLCLTYLVSHKILCSSKLLRSVTLTEVVYCPLLIVIPLCILTANNPELSLVGLVFQSSRDNLRCVNTGMLTLANSPP